MSGSDELLYRAKLAEQAERYDEMVGFMRRLCGAKESDLEGEERNMLALAYKNVVGARRASWRVVLTIESKERQRAETAHDENRSAEAARGEKRAATCRDYRLRLESELAGVCDEVLALIRDTLLPRAGPDVAAVLPAVFDALEAPGGGAEKPMEEVETEVARRLDGEEALTRVASGEAVVFYVKMMGDHYRYLAEFSVEREEARTRAAHRSLAAYQVASEVAKLHLVPTSPVRLGLALNFSVFYYEIMSQPDRACQLAKDAFDHAIAELDQVAPDSYRDSTIIMQLLRDNLRSWTADMQGA